jgi:uncharacterized membrane protein
MWFIYTLIHIFLMALVNYTDEHLATDNKLPQIPNIHTRVGSVLIISTLMCFIGAIILMVTTNDIHLAYLPMALAFLSAIPMVAHWATYFYLLQSYPVHQVIPISQLSSVWLLLMELGSGGTITKVGLGGIFTLLYGAYILDAGTFKWKIPTKLFLIALPTTALGAITLFIVRAASASGSVVGISFWQMIATGIIGILLFSFVKKYRAGFTYRIRNQGKTFLGLSLVNETFSEAGYLFSNLAVAIAPVAAYVSAMTGVQGLFVLLLFWMFPQGKRTKVTPTQWFSIILIGLGVFLIENN